MSEVIRVDSAAHETWILRCIELAKRGAGTVSPNPIVGAVLVDSHGAILAEGWHKAYGEAHAERNALDEAVRRHGLEALKRATLYVNLEPCSHFGKTPPCSDLIIEHQIPRVVVGMVDPNPAVRGTGISRMKAHGIEVVEGVCEAACQRTNEAFTNLVETGRPLITLKMAQTLDGRVATRTGHSQWVSGKASRQLVHQWRASLDAVLVGARTAMADDPSLTVRHVDGRQPWRIVLDREGRLPESLRLFSDPYASKTIAVTAAAAPQSPAYACALEKAGGLLLYANEREGHLDLHQVFSILGRGLDKLPPLQSVLVEAGPGLATALLQQDLVDRFFLFIAPKIIGQGIPVIDNLDILQMKEAVQFAESRWEQVGQDMLFQGYRRRF